MWATLWIMGRESYQYTVPRCTESDVIWSKDQQREELPRSQTATTTTTRPNQRMDQHHPLAPIDPESRAWDAESPKCITYYVRNIKFKHPTLQLQLLLLLLLSTPQPPAAPY